MNNFQCRYLSDFTDGALKPLDYIENNVDDVKSILNHREAYDDYDYFKQDILNSVDGIIYYIKEIRRRF
jgi:hypothetical protein